MLIMSARERDRAHMSALTDFYFMSALIFWPAHERALTSGSENAPLMSTWRSWAHEDHERDRERIYFLTIYPAFIVMPYFNVMLKSRQDFEAGPRHWSIWACQARSKTRPGLNIIENIWIIGFNQGIIDTLRPNLSHFYRFLTLLTTIRAI